MTTYELLTAVGIAWERKLGVFALVKSRKDINLGPIKA